MQFAQQVQSLSMHKLAEQWDHQQQHGITQGLAEEPVGDILTRRLAQREAEESLRKSMHHLKLMRAIQASTAHAKEIADKATALTDRLAAMVQSNN